jgi:hypothetical protein
MGGSQQAQSKGNYDIQVLHSPLALDATTWDALLAQQPQPTPFMQHAYLAALERSGSAIPQNGWTPRFLTLRDAAGRLRAACPLYLKSHSRGEYVFDWAWAQAHAHYGLPYYPKAVIAVPYTPVPGSRLLAASAHEREALITAARDWCLAQGLSSLHLLFGHATDLQACAAASLMQRPTVQFHWHNRQPELYRDFDDFLAALSQDKRKKIRQERRKVRDAGVTVSARQGASITASDWDLFYLCYERTYLEHGNPPYLTRQFFEELAQTQAAHWLLFVARRGNRSIACSLVAIDEHAHPKTAWGRYWGALERVDCLHFEVCYYSPLQWCIEHGYWRFEGGAQGEHKLARALLPQTTPSAHWLAHARLGRAVAHALERESALMDDYLDELTQHSPLRALR